MNCAGCYLVESLRRRPKRVHVLALVVGLIISFPALTADPTYTYRPTVSHDANLCDHERAILNRDFRRLWEAPPLGLADENHYSESSAGSFLTRPGASLQQGDRFLVRYSAIPTNSEYSAITWEQGRVIDATSEDRPPVGAPSIATTRIVLVAHFDFDNDGTMDTVVKDGFSQGYNAMALGGGNDLFSERLWVWRGRDQAVDAALPWPALVAGNRTSTPNPILVTASYVRPRAF